MSIPLLSKPEIHWALSKKIIILDNVLDSDVCDRLIEFGEKNVIQGVNKYPRQFQIKFHSCLLPLDTEVHNLLQPAWEKAIEQLQFDISFIEPYELKKYVAGNFFGKHIDNYYSITENLDRKITFSIQLNEGYDGGKMYVANQEVTVNKGSAIIFPSNFLHEVRPVLSGTRWSLIGWAWGPYWR